jgi:hypothetical protein
VVGAATSESVAEISIGRFDESFATRSGWIMAALAALVVVVLLLVSLLTLLPSDDGGSWLERVRAVVVIGLASAGVIVLLAGVWMTILEMRGRLRSTVQISAPPADDHGRAAEGGSPQVDVGSVVGGMRDSLASTARESRGARGTVSTIVTGVVLLLLALLGASSLDIQVSTGGPEPAGSPSPVIETPVAPEAPQG